MQDIDFGAERDLLAHHDFPALNERLHTALRRRLALTTAAVAALISLLLAGAIAGLHGLHGIGANANNCPCDVVTDAHARASIPPVALPALHPTAAALAEPVHSALNGAALNSAPPKSAPARARTSAAPIVLASSTTAPAASVATEAATQAAPPPDATSDVVEGEGSRLHTQLALYADAQDAALADPERALTRAQTLRDRFPDGPLAVEAGLLRIRVLIDQQKLDDARSELDALKNAAAAGGKSGAWAKLATVLHQPVDLDDDDTPSRVIR